MEILFVYMYVCMFGSSIPYGVHGSNFWIQCPLLFFSLPIFSIWFVGKLKFFLSRAYSTHSHTHPISNHKKPMPAPPAWHVPYENSSYQCVCVRKIKASLGLMAKMNITCSCVNANTHLIFYLWFYTSFSKCVCTWGDAFTPKKYGNMNDSLFKCVFRFFSWKNGDEKVSSISFPPPIRRFWWIDALLYSHSASSINLIECLVWRCHKAQQKNLWNLLHTIYKIQHNLMDSQYTIESIIHMYAKCVRFIALQMAGIHFWIMRFHYTRISILNGKYLVWSSLPIHRCTQYTLERHNLFGNNKLNGVLVGWWWYAFIINAKVNVKIIDVYTIFYFSLKEKPCIFNSWVILYVSQGLWDQ